MRIGTGVLATALLVASGLAGCGGGRGEEPADPSPAPDQPGDPAHAPPPPAPWSAAPLRDAPAVYLREWSQAENRATCAPLAFRSPGPEGADATPRAARFGGGWGVAYDLPELRSAFGVAGTGVEPGPATYDDWPHRAAWADGSEAGWGPEGGSGPNQLAYLEVSGQGCLYNVWSRLGPRHLERLLGELRYIEGGGPAPDAEGVQRG